MKACVKTLEKHPTFNSSLDIEENNLIIKKYYNIGIAVDTKAGLVVPVIKDVDQKNIVQLSKELVDLSSRAKDKKLKPEEMKGGTYHFKFGRNKRNRVFSDCKSTRSSNNGSFKEPA